MFIRIFFLLSVGLTISCKSQEVQNQIVLVNIDSLDRNGIAEVISAVDSLGPEVVAIDLQFSRRTEYEADLNLVTALYNCRHLVMVSVIKDYNGREENYYGFIYGTLPEFLPEHAKTGFGNTIHEDDEVLTLKKFSAYEQVNGKIEYQFSVRVAMEFDSLKTTEFLKRNTKIIEVDYNGVNRNFKVFSSAEFLTKKISRVDIERKIVMIGFLGPGNEDKFYTPLNSNPDEPDMYGLEYLANIVAQVLESK